MNSTFPAFVSWAQISLECPSWTVVGTLKQAACEQLPGDPPLDSQPVSWTPGLVLRKRIWQSNATMPLQRPSNYDFCLSHVHVRLRPLAHCVPLALPLLWEMQAATLWVALGDKSFWQGMDDSRPQSVNLEVVLLEPVNSQGSELTKRYYPLWYDTKKKKRYSPHWAWKWLQP